MPQSLVKILAHVVFSTKDRMNLIAPEIEIGLYGYIGGIVKNNNSKLIVVGGTANHVHLLISLGKKIDIGDLVGDIKRDSSKWMKEQGVAKFYWQKGYGAFSIGQSQVKAVLVYIKNQKAHHAKQDYKSEFRELLTKYEIDFDERYVWD